MVGDVFLVRDWVWGLQRRERNRHTPPANPPNELERAGHLEQIQVEVLERHPEWRHRLELERKRRKV